MPKYVSVGCRVTTPHGYLSGILGCLEILAKWAKSSNATRTGGSEGERGHVMGNFSTKDKAVPYVLAQDDPGLFYSWVSGGQTPSAHVQDDVSQSVHPCPPATTHADRER